MELGILVSNILNAKRYSNCRLCLKDIKNDYVRMDDTVCIKIESTTALNISLSEALNKLFGTDMEDFSVELPGIEACCTDCVKKALQALRFLETSKQSLHTLNEVVNNLTKTLVDNYIEEGNNQAMYISIEDESTKILLQNKEPKKRKTVKKDEYVFECVKCNEYFIDFVELKVHNLMVHNTHTCDKCYEVFLSEADLRMHNKSNHRFECVECSQSWDSEESLYKHQDRVHNIHVCKDCGKSYKGLDRLHLHEAKHVNVSECPKCGKQYTTREFYVKHVTLCLKNQIDPHPLRSNYKKIYTCEKCDKSYSTPGGLRVHIRFAHENAKPHVCKECGKKFTAPSYLKIHMIKHTGEKNFECEICKGRFVSKEALLYHTRRHTGEKPYSCKICNERFVNASARAEHIKYKHVGPTLMCEICSRKFVTSLFLRQHMSRHHDPSSKLYYGRNMIPPNVPGEQNMRIKVETE